MMIRLSLVIGGALLLCGCAGPYYKSHEIRSGAHMVARDASISVAMVERSGDRLRLCMQGAPDAAFDQDASFSLSANIASFGSGGDGEGEGSEEAEMAGRSPGLLFARELFYRTCEVALSTNASPEEWRAMFTTALQTSAEIMKLEAQNTRIDVKDDVEDDNRASVDRPATLTSAPYAPPPSGTSDNSTSGSAPPPYNPANVPPPSQ